MKKIRKVSFNKERYNNVLEIKPKEIEIADVGKSAFMYNYYDLEKEKKRALSDDDNFNTEAYCEFADKCEKELLEYIKSISETGSAILSLGTYDVGNIHKPNTKTLQTITPRNNIIEFFHALIDYQVREFIKRYCVFYTIEDEEEKEKLYKELILGRHDIDNILDSDMFSIESALHIDYEDFKDKAELRRDDDSGLKIFASYANALFQLHTILTTEKLMLWNKDYIAMKNCPGLYPLLNTIWHKEVKKLYVKILLTTTNDELNNKDLEKGYFRKKIRENEDGNLFKASVPERIYNAPPKVYRLLNYMSELFSNTLNNMFRTLSNVAIINNNHLTVQKDFKEGLDMFREDVRDNIKSKYETELNTKEERYLELEKEVKRLKTENDKLTKSTDKAKMLKLEKQHKEDLKKIRALTSEKNKKEREYKEQIEIYKCVYQDTEESVVAEDVIIPDIPEDMKIAFCMQDKPGLEKIAKALVEEFPDATIVHNPTQITNHDVVVYLTEILNHSLYYAYKKAAEKIGCYTWHTMSRNPKLIREKLAAYLYNKKGKGEKR